MTLPSPNLDNRRYDDLVAEALRRVPRYTPEWTNHMAPRFLRVFSAAARRDGAAEARSS